MQETKDSIPFWLLSGLCLATALALVTRIGLLLTQAYQTGDLTRDVLVEALLWCLGVLAVLALGGWSMAYRPRPDPVRHESSPAW